MHREAGRILKCAKSLFHYNKAQHTLKQELPNANIRLALTVFLAAALISAILAVAIAAASMYMTAFEYGTLSEASNIDEPEIQWKDLVPVALFQFLFLVPFSLVFGLAYEGIAYHAIRITGGKGTFTQQYYLSSLVALSLTLSLVLGFLTPVPCLQILAVLALMVLALYFTFFVNAKAYQVVHDISYPHAFAIVLLLIIPGLLVILFAISVASAFFGLPAFVP